MAHLPLLLVAIAVVTFTGAAPLSEDDSPNARAATEIRADPKDYRLPDDVVPVSYKLLLTPHLEDKFTFDGESEIKITAVKATKNIVLHANDSLTIKSVQIFMLNTTEISFFTTSRNPMNDFFTITLIDPLFPKTDYILKLVFEGKLNDDLRGFYRSHYTNSDGEKRWLATTQFQPTYTRRAFPCWDEPHLKATFDISIRHPKHLQALSNMHEITIEADITDSTKCITTFATTPIMTANLVAFVVSDFESLSNKDGSFNIWARSNAIRHGEFALEKGQQALKALEEYTGITHASTGFKKMDSIVIPQLAFAAMENWALVTYRESFLLVEENVTTSAGKELIARVISHEFAHQWFGNLVSPLWWAYTWLNEGFANYFQYIITDKVLPTWRMKDIQVVADLQTTAFADDSVSTAVDMNYDANSPTEILAKFNITSYQKAGSVIRMIAHILGEKQFQTALQKYLQTMKFSAATSDDLFAEFVKVFPNLTGVTAKPLDILNNWANTPGFPLINVIRNYEKGTVDITQERYLYKSDDAHKESYYVPINYAKERKDFDDTTVTSWLEKNNTITNLNVTADKTKWIIFNKQHFGYYRVNYDEKNWKLIADFLKTTNYTHIHVLNRGQLVDDALNLARNGKLKYRVALNLMRFLKQDFDYVPWYSALTGFTYLQITLTNTGSYASFKNYLLELLKPVLKDVKFYESLEDDHLRKLLRVQVINWACKLGSKPCRDQASMIVKKWLKNSKANRIAPDLKDVILCAGVCNANQGTWDQLFAKYLTGEEDSLLTALGCSSNTNILKGYLTKAIDKSVNITNRDGVFSTVIQNSEDGVNVALDFVLVNADKIYELSGNNTESLKTYITNIGSRISTKVQLKKLKAAKNQHVKKVRADGVSRAKECLDWLTVHESQFMEYFKKKDTNTEPIYTGTWSKLT